VEDLGSMLHPEVVMVFPGFAGRIRGRQQLVDSFRDFCVSARIHEFRDHDYQSDVAGKTAVASFQYEMVYERSGELYRSTGRDLWVFQCQGDTWIAVWRTMLDIREEPA
jgi:hypothetical protein